jgi:hypothetical protein
MRPKLRVPLLVLAAALLALPASAAAETESKSATAAGHLAIATATAKCPSGQRATGGGFAAPAPTLTNNFIRVYESRKVGQRRWRASGQLYDAPYAPTGIAQTVTAFAYCSDSAPSTEAKSASVSPGVGGSFGAFYTADARCSSGKAQAGGFLTTPPITPSGGTTNRVTDSYRAGNKIWRSRMVLFRPATVTAYVYCADEQKPAARVGSATSATNNSFVSVTALSAECKGDARPRAGGFSQPTATLGPTTETTGYYRLIYESRKSGKRWRVSAQRNGSTSTTLNSIAYCA